MTAEAARRIEGLILSFEPPPLPAVSTKRLLQAASGDKKNRAGVRRFVLLQGLGNAVVAEDVTDAEVVAAIERSAASLQRQQERQVAVAAPGAQPEGTGDEASAAAAVRSMFDQIAPRYDLLNHVLSCNIDRIWWRRAARSFRQVLARPDAQVLDLCCGTGDMTLALLRRRPKNGRPVLAADFAHQMLLRGAAKFAPHGAIAFEADALHLPLPAGSLDLLTTAFGFRNLANYRAGLEEFYRTLEAGRRAGHPRLQRTGRRYGQAVCLLLPPGSSCRGLADLGGLRAVPLSSPLRAAVPCPPGIAANHAIGWL